MRLYMFMIDHMKAITARNMSSNTRSCNAFILDFPSQKEIKNAHQRGSGGQRLYNDVIRETTSEWVVVSSEIKNNRYIKLSSQVYAATTHSDIAY